MVTTSSETEAKASRIWGVTAGSEAIASMCSVTSREASADPV